MMRLDYLGRCPVCGSEERKPSYQRVRDGVFGTPGEWDYWECGCSILYLDPRPSSEALAQAYATYYTHSSSGAPLRWREPGFRGAVRRGYLNARYGYGFPKASRLAGLTWPLRRSAVRNLDFMIRHLPAPRRNDCRLLDIGFGNGDFLEVAEDLGYRATGIDPDPKAVDLARSRGLDVRCATVPDSGELAGSFEHVFLSHVIEHLPDPVAALAEAASLLVPGGRLWLSTPNLRSIGLARFGRHWRGLEPPRHLALFDSSRLAELIGRAGFERVRLLPPEDAAAVYFRQSQAIASGVDPAGDIDPPGWEAVRRAAAAASRRSRISPGSAESVTMIAWTGERRSGRPL
jgi:SAM-dependent methyltransferase